MKIATKYHGEIEYNKKDILTFPKGIPGFPIEKEFILLPLSEDAIFYSMQSIKTTELAFIVSSPFNFFEKYDFKLEDQFVEELDLKSERDVLVYSILTVRDPFNQTTANLQAPIIINAETGEAKQVILYDETYNTKHPIFENAKAKG